MNGGGQVLHGLAPKRANSASVRRRKTNNPSLESLTTRRARDRRYPGVESERQGQRKRYSNPTRSSVHSKFVKAYLATDLYVGQQYSSLHAHRCACVHRCLPHKMPCIILVIALYACAAADEELLSEGQ